MLSDHFPAEIVIRADIRKREIVVGVRFGIIAIAEECIDGDNLDSLVVDGFERGFQRIDGCRRYKQAIESAALGICLKNGNLIFRPPGLWIFRDDQIDTELFAFGSDAFFHGGIEGILHTRHEKEGQLLLGGLPKHGRDGQKNEQNGEHC